MDDALLFIHWVMKLSLVVGLIVLVATAPLQAHARGHGQQAAAAPTSEHDQDAEPSRGRRMLLADDARWLQSDDASPSMNLDGTPMFGDLVVRSIKEVTK